MRTRSRREGSGSARSKENLKLIRAVGRIVDSVFGQDRRGLRPQWMERLEDRTMLSNTELPLVFNADGPGGGQIFDSTNTGYFDPSVGSNQSQLYSLNLTNPELFSASVSTTDSTVQLQLSIQPQSSDTPIQQETASAVGSPVALSNVPLQPGNYTLFVTDLTDFSGSGEFKVLSALNTALSADNTVNTSPATAIDLSGSSVPLDNGSDRLAVEGNFGTNTNYYSFQLNAGQFLSATSTASVVGTGQFNGGQTEAVSAGTVAVATGDFNGDGRADFVAVGTTPGTTNGFAEVFLNNGDGTFTLDQTFTFDLPATSVVVGDFDGDGNLDIAVGENDGAGNGGLAIFFGDGQGDFPNNIGLGGPGGVTAMATGDFNGSGRPQLALAMDNGDGTGLLRIVNINTSQGIDSLSDYGENNVPTSIATGDLNNDGSTDILLGFGDQSYVADLYNDGTGSFYSSSRFGTVAPVAAVTIGDFTGSGINNEVYVLESDNGSAEIEEGFRTPQGGLSGYAVFGLAGGSFTDGAAVTTADINGDGISDLILTRGATYAGNYGLIVAQGSPDGLFDTDTQTFPVSNADGVAVGDFNGYEGETDIIAASTAYDPTNLDSGGNVSLFYEEVGAAPATLGLLDANGNPLAISGYTNNGIASISQFAAPYTGTYYLSASGQPGQPYQAVVTRGAALQPEIFFNNIAQDVTGANDLIGSLNAGGSNNVDYFVFGLNAGDTINFSVIAPQMPDAASANTLEAHLQLDDPNNTDIAGSLDNGTLSYTVPAGGGGLYSVFVVADSGQGNFDVTFSGDTGTPSPMTVSRQSLSDGQVVNYVPSSITVYFSEPLLASSVSAGDLLVNGQPADSVTLNGGSVATFNFSSIVTGDGVYNITLNPGSITDTQGQALTAGTSLSFTVDTGPEVIASSLSPGDTVAPGSVSEEFTFNEPVVSLLTEGVFGQFLLFNAVSLTNLTTGQNYPVSQFQFGGETDDARGDSTITSLTAEFQNVPEGAYQIDLQAEDVIDSNFVHLSGAPSFPLPSGGYGPNNDFVFDFYVHQQAPVALATPTLLSPLGSQALQSAPFTGGAIVNGDEDDYTLSVNAGEQISALLNVTSGSMQPQMQLADPNGNVIGTASSDGSTAMLQDVTAPTTGTYTLRITSLGGDGAYTLQAQLNAAFQIANNNSSASAQALDFSDTDTGGATRADVTGAGDGNTPDFYSLTLTAGQRVSAAMTINGTATQPNEVMELLDSSGDVLAVGTPETGSLSSTYVIQDFAAPAAGTYFLSVVPNGSYNLVVSTNSSLEVEPNDFPANTPQDISATDQVMGYISSATDDDSYTFTANPGDVLTLKTSIPGDGGADSPDNGLSTVLYLYGPDGTQLMANQGGNPQDLHGSQISYVVPSIGAGTYRVSVESFSGAIGTYVLSIQGATGSPNVIAPMVVSTTPAAGGSVAHAPGTITVVFSEPIDPTSINPSDLAIDGGSTVTAAQTINGETVQFTVSIPDVTDLYNISIPAGSIKSLSGQPIAAYATTLFVDHVGPRVISQFPVTQASAPFSSWVFTFSKPINPNSFLYARDNIDSFTGPGGTNLIFDIESEVVSGNTVTVTFEPQDGQGTYTMVLDQGIMDLVGNEMDQNQNGINGENPGDRYTATLSLASPDLTVTSVQPATGAVFGSPLSVTWTVQNIGSDSANDGWTDKVYLSDSPTLDGSQVLLGTFNSPSGPLAAEASYTTTQSVNLPLNDSVVPGNQYIVVVTNANNHQAETDTTNDTNSGQVNISLPPLPDLAIFNVTAPAELVAGGTATINWTLANVGNADFTGSFREAVELTTNSNGVNADTLAYVTFDGTLPANSTTAGSTVVTIPLGTSGNYYFVVDADVFGQVFEYPNKANNTSVSTAATNITLSAAPDFVAINLALPAGPVYSGHPVTFTWTVSNQGTADFNGTFYEVVLLSPNPDGSAADQSVQISFTGPLSVGQSVQQNATIDLPLSYSGDRYVELIVNYGNSVFENPLGQANDVTISPTPINVIQSPLSDLTVPSVTAPATALSNGSIPISWTDKNLGPAIASGTWYDNVYLSPDGSLADATNYGQFQVTATIAPGASLDRTEDISLPATLTGTYYVIVVADAYDQLTETTQSNDTGVSSGTLTVSLAPYPDLVVSTVNDPPTAFSGQPFTVSWTEENVGTGPTTAPVWYDFVYISSTPNFSGSDQLLGSVVNQSYLAPGQGYTTTATFTMPQSYSGTFYVIVQADAYNQVAEFGPNGESNNLTTGGPIAVTLTPPADLAVTVVTAPPDAFSGQSTNVIWQVTNVGPAATLAADSTWTDEVYLSSTPTLGSDAVSLGEFDHTGVLNPGQSYYNQATITLPIGISGPYYFIVVTNVFQNVFENGQLGNNTLASNVTNVALTPPPDLAVTSVTAPPTTLAGHYVEVTYTVANQGFSATPNYNWADSLYISSSPTFDSSATLLNTQEHAGALDVGDSYTATIYGQLPYTLSGQYYLFIKTNSDSLVFEVNTANDVASTPISVTYAPPDLVVDSVSAPTSALSGSGFLAFWTVTNQGAGDTVATEWNDSVYLSLDTNLNNSADDIFLGSYEHASLPLAAGASYTAGNQAVFIPPTVPSGSYYLFVITNSNQTVYEGAPNSPATLNDVSIPVPITVTQLSPDLQVSAVSSVPTLQQGQTQTVNWTVTNAGNAVTNAFFWYDDVYIVPSGNFGLAGATLLARVQHTNPLSAGGSYNASTTVAIPPTLALGSYKILVVADSLGYVAESFPNGRTDNVTASNTFNVEEGPEPDLAVTAVNPPATALSGQTILVTYTVTNVGTLATSGAWYDTVYLSLDQTLDPQSDIALGSVQYSAGLAAGANYVDRVEFNIPAGVAGSYYLFVDTDSSDRITTDPNPNNNIGYGATPVDIILPAPTDIAVGTVTLPNPATASLGLNLSITYTISNLSGQTAQGSWEDAVYLSTSNVFDPTATLLGTATHIGNVAPGGSYTATITAPVPGLNPGNYYIIVRTDIRDVLPETTKANNIGASLGQVTLSLPTLTLGAPATGTLTTGQSIYYEVTVPYGQTLYVTLNSDHPTADNQLYLRYGSVPTQSTFDYSYSSPLSADQSITVPLTQAGTYYLLAYASALPGAASENYTLTATLPQFSVTDTRYGTGGTAGQLTIQVNGAKFDRTVTALLSGVGGTFPATEYYYVSSDRLYTTFDLTQVPPGVYDVDFQNSQGQTATVPGGLTVVAGGGANVTPGITSPAFGAAGKTITVSATWSNTGDDDGESPLLAISTNGAIGRDAGFINQTAYSFYAPAPGDGPAGILLPGQEGDLVFFSTEPTGGGEYFDIYGLTNLSQPFDYSTLYSELIDPGESDQQFAPVYQQMQQDIGPTTGDLLAALSQDATLLPDQGILNQIPSTLLQVSLDRATAELNTSITGSVFAPDISIDISGQNVTAENIDTGQQFVTTSYTDGSFVFPTLTAGTYNFLFDGAIVTGGNGVVVAPGEQVTGVTISLSAGDSVLGTVRDASTHLPLSGADVTVAVPDGSTYLDVTDSNGNYSISGLPEGPYTIFADDDGYGRAFATFTPTPGVNAPDLSLAAAATITGSFTTPAGDNAPVTVTATLDSQPGQGSAFAANLIGSTFSITGLPAGNYHVLVMQSGSVAQQAAVTLATGDSVDLGTIALVPPASISGALSPEVSSIPVASIAVDLLSNGSIVESDYTDSTGTFSFGGLLPGTYMVHVEAETSEGEPQDVTQTVSAGQIVSGLSVPILRGDQLNGVVTSSSTGNGLVGITVTAVASDGTLRQATTGAGGAYQLPFLPSGVYQVSIVGVSPVQVTLAAPDGSAATQNFVASVTGVITGQLTAGGSPISGFVSLFENGQFISAAGTDANGDYSLPVAIAGAYVLVAEAGNASFVPVSVSLAAGAVLTENFAAGSASLQVTVTDSFQAVAGDYLYVNQITSVGPVEVAVLNPAADGTATISNLVPGEYQLQVTTLSGATVSTTVTVGAGESLVVPLTAAVGDALSGTITDAAGGTPPQASVEVYSTAGGIDSNVAVAFTDSDGTYTLYGLSDGTYDVVIIAASHQTMVFTNVVVASGGATLNAALAAATGQINGTVVDTAGNPITIGKVTITDSAGRVLGTATLNSDGTFLITGVSGSNLTVTVTSPGYRPIVQALPAVSAAGTTSLGELHLTLVAYPAQAVAASGSSQPASAMLSSTSHTPSAAYSAGSIIPAGLYSFITSAINKLNLAPDLSNIIGSTFDQSPNQVFVTDIPGLDTCKTLVQVRNNLVKLVRKEGKAYYTALDEFNQAYSYVFEVNLAGYNAFLQTAGAVASCFIIIDGLLTAGAAAGVFKAGSTAFKVLSGGGSIGADGVILAENVGQLGPGATRFAYQFSNALANILGSLDTIRKAVVQASNLTTIAGLIDALKNFANLDQNYNNVLLSAIALFKNIPPSLAALAGGIGAINSALGQLLNLSNFSFNNASSALAVPLANLEDEISAFQQDQRRYLNLVEQSRQGLLQYQKLLHQCENEICNPTLDQFVTTVLKAVTKAVQSNDPNDILGPQSFGPDDFVSSQSSLNYEIQFQNDATASAPTQVVTITQNLDPSLDPRTFRLGTIDIAGDIITPPSNVAFYSTQVDLTATLGVDVDVFAGINVITNQAFWIFTAIDPATGEQPVNPLLGLLPPDVTPPEGEGFVTYTISPLAGVATGTVVSAQATVVFDANAPIDTPIITDTLDGGDPTSTVAVLPSISAPGGINLSWSGTDDENGSGIASFTIYASIDGRPFMAWLSDTTTTSAVYPGTPGHAYAFYSIATDNVGNVQPTPAAAQASTTVTGPQALFTNLAAAVTETYGTATVTFTGTVSANSVLPQAGETVNVTLFGVTLPATINSAGQFSATFDTSTLQASTTPYQVTYSYAGDSQLGSAADSTTTTLTMNPAPLTVMLTGGSKVYGSADPSFGANITGFVNSDTIADLAGVLVISTSEPAAVNAPVGTYSVNAAGLASGNYAITYVPGVLQVTPAPLTITAGGGSIAQGQPLPTFTVMYSGFISGDSASSLTTFPTVTTPATSTSPVGMYAVMASGAVDPNYTITYVPGTLTITQPVNVPDVFTGSESNNFNDPNNWSTGAVPGSSDIAVINSGTVVATSAINVAALILGGSSTTAALQLATGTGTSTIGSLTLNIGSTLDITNNTVLIDYSSGPDPILSIQSDLARGYSEHTWSGTGISSSNAAADPTHYTIGYADGGNPTDQAVTGLASGVVEVKYTVAGDVNLDGKTDMSDLAIVGADFGLIGADWVQGDLNYDGNVDLSDLVIVASNFGSPPPPPLAASTPITADSPVSPSSQTPTTDNTSVASPPPAAPTISAPMPQKPMITAPHPDKPNTMWIAAPVAHRKTKPAKSAPIASAFSMLPVGASSTVNDGVIMGVLNTISGPATQSLFSNQPMDGASDLLD